jgi:hypothetical protein
MLGDGRQQGFAVFEIMRRKRTAVASFLARLGERQLIDAAPRHDLERGLHDPRLGFAPPFGMGAPDFGSFA